MDCKDAKYWTEQEIHGEEYAALAVYRFLRPLKQTLDSYSKNPQDWIENVINHPHDDSEKSVIKALLEKDVTQNEIGKLAYHVALAAFNQVL